MTKEQAEIRNEELTIALSNLLDCFDEEGCVEIELSDSTGIHTAISRASDAVLEIVDEAVKVLDGGPDGDEY